MLCTSWNLLNIFIETHLHPRRRVLKLTCPWHQLTHNYLIFCVNKVHASIWRKHYEHSRHKAYAYSIPKVHVSRILLTGRVGIRHRRVPHLTVKIGCVFKPNALHCESLKCPPLGRALAARNRSLWLLNAKVINKYGIGIRWLWPPLVGLLK